jgi:hypothetical protein
VASILQRVIPDVRDVTEVVPRVGATLRPRQNVAMVLHPNGGG